MGTKYKVVFHFSDNNISDGLKEVYKAAYMDIRNVACKLLNPMYEIWNDEYDQENDGLYDDYIRNLQNGVFYQINSNPYFEPLFELFSNEDCDIAVRFKKPSVCEVSITLAEV